ncbi:hypothetical protein V5O48_015124 [Marasmius crinis-equi]|uniref:NmrA-like domain-containing protein n=1 Tax=Marasmius crinis-equi TaxID=585013 RepID=A0ABR3EVD5_9AGAR
MPQQVKILVTGATGYIGGAVLGGFLARPDASSLDFRAIVRSPEKAEKLKAFGITPIVGSHNDEELMVKAASEVDVVLAMADSNDLPAAQATLKGLKKRFEETGTPPIFIHTSGTGSLIDNAAGMYASDIIYDDSDPDQIETLPATQAHRHVDLELRSYASFTAANTDSSSVSFVVGYIKSYIVLPTTIYSIAQGPLFEAGISNSHSVQVPRLIRASIARKQAGMVGKGANFWPNVDVHELADLYSTLWDSIIKNTETGHGRQGYYFGANGEHRLYDVGQAIGEALVALGISKSPEPTTFTQEELKKYFEGVTYSEHNSRCRASRSKSIGWNPKMTTEDFLKSIKPEVEAWVRKGAAI